MQAYDNGRKRATAVLLVSAAALAAYFNSLGNGFVYDDIPLITKNPMIRSWGGASDIFGSGFWSSLGTTGGFYRPLAILSFLLDHSVWGLRPFGYHLTNVVLHILCSVTAYFLLRYIFSGETNAPLFAAVLFAVHPVHTEVVTWCSGRGDLLAALFVFLALLVSIRRPPSRSSAALSCVLYLFALLSKESSVIMPALLAVYILLFEEHPSISACMKALAIRLLPFALVFAAYMAVRMTVLSGSIGPDLDTSVFYGVDRYHTFLGVAKAFTQYIRLVFLPFDLKTYYLFSPPSSIMEPQVLFSITAFAATALLAQVIIRLSRPVFFAVCLFFIGLIPVSHIIPIEITMAERALYISSFGACMLVSVALSRIYSEPGRYRAATVLFAVLVVIFATGSLRRNPYWEDNDRLNASLMALSSKYREKYPNMVWNNIRYVWSRMGEGDYGPETESILKDAMSRRKNDPDIFFAYARLSEHNGRLADALDAVDRAISMRANQSRFFNLRAKLLDETGRHDEAEKMMEEAYRLDPDDPDNLFSKACLLEKRGEVGEALTLYGRYARMKPGDYEGFMRQGIILGSRGRFEEAVKSLSKAAELKPDDPQLHYHMACAYYGLRNVDASKKELETAIRLKPDYPEARELLLQLDRG